MDILNLINRLRSNNIDIALSGNDLEISYDGDELPAAMLTEIKHSKTAIVDFLKKLDTGKETGIRTAPPQADYPVSSSQRRLWILSRLDESSTAYHLPEVHVFDGKLDPDAFEYAFDALVARHEILRTIFREDEDGEVRQIVRAAGSKLIFDDLRNDEQQESTLGKYKHSILRQPFDLTAGPLLRAGLFRVADNKWVLAYVMHHIISDGWSMDILVKELMLLYNAHTRRLPDPLSPLRIQYKDYAVWQQEQLQNGILHTHRSYWLQQFSGELPILELPADNPRPVLKTYRGATASTTVNYGLSEAMRVLCHEKGCTLFMGMLATVNALFYRYTGQEDIIVGTPVAGRDHTDLENQIGFYINTLALRSRFSGADSFDRLLQNVKQVTLAAYEHQSFPFDELVNELHLKRDMSRNPLFDVMVVMQNAKNISAEQVSLGNMNVGRFGREQEVVSKFDLTFDFIEVDGEIRIEIEYSTDIFSAENIQQLCAHLVQLLEAAVRAPHAPVRELDYLSAEEKQLLQSFNNSSSPYQHTKTLINLFEEQVQRTPGKTVIISEDGNLSFEELNNMSNRLAHYLKQQYNIQPDDLIAIKLDRGKWMMVAIVAVLKAGGAYVPIDPQFPQERVDYILQDSGCKAVIDGQEVQKGEYNSENPTPSCNPNHLAYCIYTSGSTGKPKGCLLQHTGVVNRIEWMWKHYGFTPDDIILQKTSFTFDVSVWEIFMPLCWGATMVICKKEDARSAERIAFLIQQHQITCLHFVPGMLNDFIATVFDDESIALQSLTKAFASGEALLPETVKQWYNKVDIPLHNLYGPTEASVDVTYYPTSRGDNKIPIGKPVWNTQMYVLSDAKQLVPTGVAGEIYISGIQLARGYLNRPELTTEKFINWNGERLYRTGDLGKWLPDGNILYLGRIDHQVKVRGYRIELGEIECALQRCQQVDAALVVSRGGTDLIAYLVSKQALNITEIRAHLATFLPDYMLPNFYVQLEKFPLNASGKIDRKQLPEPGGSTISAGTDFIPPATATEKKLAAIWKELLRRDEISIKDDFFNLGGHSLKASRLASHIYKAFQVKFSLKELFEKSTLEAQARRIDQSAKTSFVAIMPAPAAADYPLSSSQQRLWIACQFREGNIAYNVPGVFLFEGKLNKGAFERAFHLLIARHEILRTAFIKNERGEVRQRILAPEQIAFRVKFSQEQNISEECSKPFDLTCPPLLRATVVQVEKEKWVFIFVIHHIVSDGWSMNILFNELLSFYNGEQLEPLQVHYKDYAAWQQEQLAGPAFAAHREYWLKQFEGPLPVIELPGDKMRPPLKTYNGSAVTSTINQALTTQLKSLASQRGTTLFMALLAVVKTLLYRYTRQQDIIIGCPIAGREHIDLENQVGLYLNTIALRTQFNGADSYLELLENIRQVTTGAYEHQAYPFDVLVQELNLHRDVSRNPLFDITMELQTAEVSEPQGELKIFEYRTGKIEFVKFDLYFKFIERAGGIELLLHYNSDIYAAPTIERMARHIESLLAAVLNNPASSLNELEYLSDEEVQQLMVESHVDYPSGQTVIDLFEEQVRLVPENIAIAFEGVQLTYKELDEKVNRLANHLVGKVKADEPVAILLPPCPEMIVAIFGILKSGAAYVPIDPELPPARIAFLLKDTGAKVLLTTTACEFDGSIVYMDQPLDAPATAPNVHIQPQHLAYIIYTSGSTGLPKGVMISHASLIDYVFGILDKTNLRECRSFGMASTFAADVGNTVIYTSLLIGGTMHFYERHHLMDPEHMFASGLDMLKIVPSHFKALQSTGKTYVPKKCLILGGEQLTPDIIELVRNSPQPCEVYNHYGPTEVTIAKVLNHVDLYSDQPIALGSPFCNSAVYIVDDRYKLVPIGVLGEICIAGPGLARGYLNQPELTAQKFVPNPFKTGDRIYKTGDLGRWLPDGTIEFFGRKDDQVKVRGYRIELGEIETALRKHPHIDSSFVRVWTNSAGEKELVAYIVCNKICNDVRSHLSGILPAYMVPNHFITLDRLPLTPNGKVDRKQLPEPSGAGENNSYVPPVTNHQKILARIWEELLNKQQIGINDDYFELGGNSLKVISILKRISEETGIAVPVREFFTGRTIEKTALYMDGATPTKAESIRVEYGEYPSYNQLTFLTGWKQGNPLVITPYEYESLDIEAFTSAVHQLAARHDVLRTKFIKEGNVIKQEIIPAETFRIPITETEVDVEAAHNRKIDPFTDPLIFVEISRKRSVLVTMHHAITDGYSDGIIRHELMQLYAKQPLKPLQVQYNDFIAWQRGFVRSPEGEKHKQYWLKKLDGFIPDLGLGSAISTQGDKAICVTGTIKLDQQNGLTRPALLLGALNLLLRQLTGINDITIYVTVSGRNSAKPDVSGLIGYFANGLLVRNTTTSLHDIQQNFLDDLTHDAYPIEKLIRELPHINPLTLLNTLVFFNYHNYAYLNEHSIEETALAIEYKQPLQMPFGLAVKEYKNCLKLEFVFDHRRFTEETARKIYQQFISLIQDITST